MRSVALRVALLIASTRHAAAHYRPADLPEWWPEEPDEPIDALPDLSGVWTHRTQNSTDPHSPRFLFAPSTDPSLTPAKPNQRYEVTCLTREWRAARPVAGGCGWKKATCTLNVSAPPSQSQLSPPPLVNASCTFDDGTTRAGNVSAGEALVFSPPSEGSPYRPWLKFTGRLSGLWRLGLHLAAETAPDAAGRAPAARRLAARLGQGPDDVLVLAHNASSGELTAWYDTSESPPGAALDWTYGVGVVTRGGLVSLSLTGAAAAPGRRSAHASPPPPRPYHQLCAGHVDANSTEISRIVWAGDGCGGGAVALWSRRRSQAVGGSDVHSVHVVFMNHLDIGYTDFAVPVYSECAAAFASARRPRPSPALCRAAPTRLPARVPPPPHPRRRYLHTYFTRAINISNAMRELGGTDRYVYGTHPMLISLLHDCPPHLDLENNLTKRGPLRCPSAAEVDAFDAAVGRGDIFWNAIPFNFEVEGVGSPDLFAASLRMAQRLDHKYNASGSRKPTRSASVRDVIHVTRSVLRTHLSRNHRVTTPRRA